MVKSQRSCYLHQGYSNKNACWWSLALEHLALFPKLQHMQLHMKTYHLKYFVYFIYMIEEFEFIILIDILVHIHI